MQTSLFGKEDDRQNQGLQLSPAEKWDMDAAKHSLDELFKVSSQYRTSDSYMRMMDFINQFPYIAPFNAMLAHIQMPGARYVLPPRKWYQYFGRVIKSEARPIVILRTMGPVDFVFDVSDTEGEPLPADIEKLYDVSGGDIGIALPMTILNCMRDGVRVYKKNLGSTAAGRIARLNPACIAAKAWQEFRGKEIPIVFELELAAQRSPEEQYATLVHELGHLYCGHLGTLNPTWWPDRLGLSGETEEFEAESVSYLVCKRKGLDTTAAKYLSDFFDRYGEVPPISVECIMKAAGLIERMGKDSMTPRKTK